MASLHEVEQLLRDDADNADALQLRDELLQSMSALRDAAAARAPAAHGAAAPAAGTDAAGVAVPVDALIGPALPPAAGPQEAANDASAAADAAAAAAGGEAAIANSAAPAPDQHEQSDQQPAAKRRRVMAPGSGNARMHPANCYADEEPDFAALAARHPALAQHVHIRQDGRCGYISKLLSLPFVSVRPDFVAEYLPLVSAQRCLQGSKVPMLQRRCRRPQCGRCCSTVPMQQLH